MRITGRLFLILSLLLMTGCVKDVKKTPVPQQKVSYIASIISAPSYDNSNIKFEIKKNINGVLWPFKREKLTVWISGRIERLETDYAGELTVNLRNYLTADYSPINLGIFFGEIKINSFVAYPSRCAKELIEVRVKRLWVFSEPTYNGKKIKEAVQKDRYEVLEKRSGWVKIKIANNKEGWISISCGKSDCVKTKVELKW